MNEPHSGDPTQTPPTEIYEVSDLFALSDRFQRLLAQAEDVAKEMQAAAREMNAALKRAQDAQKPRVLPDAASVRLDNRPTADATGPQTICQFLRRSPDLCFTVREIALDCSLSESTVRTYVPILRRAGLIHAEKLQAA